jgi:hypothetical protein
MKGSNLINQGISGDLIPADENKMDGYDLKYWTGISRSNLDRLWKDEWRRVVWPEAAMCGELAAVL